GLAADHPPGLGQLEFGVALERPGAVVAAERDRDEHAEHRAAAGEGEILPDLGEEEPGTFLERYGAAREGPDEYGQHAGHPDHRGEVGGEPGTRVPERPAVSGA